MVLKLLSVICINFKCYIVSDFKVKRVLIIRFRRVGDSVLAVCLFKSLKKTFPGVKIDFVLNENIAPLYSGHPDIDRVIAFSNEENHSVLKYISRVWRIMRETRYDVVIDMRSTINTMMFSMFSLRTPFRIGVRKKYNMFFNNYRVENRKNPLHDMVQRDLMLLNPLEKIANVQYDPSFALYAPEEERASYRDYMQRMGIDFAKPVVFVAVATRIPGKEWSLERAEEVIRKMIDKYHPQIIFNYSGEREKMICTELYEKLGRDKHIFIDVEANSLLELRSLISLCSFFFGNEGGPRHIAQAFDVPSYAIYPPGVPKRLWLPGDNTRFQGLSPNDIDPAGNEMTREDAFDLLTADRVWSGLDSMLGAYLI